MSGPDLMPPALRERLFSLLPAVPPRRQRVAGPALSVPLAHHFGMDKTTHDGHCKDCWAPFDWIAHEKVVQEGDTT